MEPIRYQRRVLGFLTGTLARKSVAHALVFTGDAGLGKQETALHFAMALNCLGEADPSQAVFGSQGPCQTCSSCRKILSGNHPDILFVHKSGTWIKIAQIRALLETLAMRPSEARTRVVVIADAGAMNAESSNALLKVLEEPSRTTCFVLLAQQKSELLPTVVSRCQEIRFAPVPAAEIARSLEENGVAPDLSQACAVLAEGSFTQAESLASPQGMARRDWLVNQLCALEDRGAAHALLLAEFLAKDKEAVATDLAWIRTWLRDLLVHRFASTFVINKDLMGLISSRAAKAGTRELLERIQAVFQCERDLARNVNTRLALEAMCVRLSSGG